MPAATAAAVALLVAVAVLVLVLVPLLLLLVLQGNSHLECSEYQIHSMIAIDGYIVQVQSRIH